MLSSLLAAVSHLLLTPGTAPPTSQPAAGVTPQQAAPFSWPVQGGGAQVRQGEEKV